MLSADMHSVVLSFEEARHLVEQHAAISRPRGKVLISLLDAAGYVLAEPVFADRAFPPFDRATRDGFAVRASDISSAPSTLQVVGEIRAGSRNAEFSGPLENGQAVSIMTGAPVPAGADTVVMIEYTAVADSGENVIIHRVSAVGENVVACGAEAKAGAQLLSPGLKLDHAGIAIAASVGRRHLLVHSKPQVAILATGDEIVDIEIQPGAAQIRNSNSYSLATQVKAAGGDPLMLPIAPDEPKRLRELIADGLEADLLLIAGGVSMGQYDLVEAALKEFQAEFLFTGAEIQPGRPIVFGRVPPGLSPEGVPPSTESDLSWKYFFGLPGNPVSTMVTFDLFVRPLLESMTGRNRQPLIFPRARLKSEVVVKSGLRRFLPAILSGEFDVAEVETVRWQGSGDIAAIARANCYLVVPQNRDRMEPGEWVPLLLRQ